MRNLKRVLSLTLASVMLMGMMVIGTSAAAQGYNDVDETHNVEAIEVLQAVGVMVGDADSSGKPTGTLRPDANVSRGEMAVIMAKLMDLDYKYYEGAGIHPFTDMVGHYAEAYVAACKANGIIAGRTTTTYDPNAGVTAIEAASMMMRALGYFKYSSDYAAGFEVATVTQGTKIDLFKGVGSNASTPMTRNQVAQIALNTLKSGMVEPSSTVSVTTTDGTTVTAGNIAYHYISSADPKYNSAISSLTAADYGQATGGIVVELGEQLYKGDLKLDHNPDAFGRHTNHWTYKTEEIGTYVTDLIATYTDSVKDGELYSLLGSLVYNDYNMTVYIDGVYRVDNDVKVAKLGGDDFVASRTTSKNTVPGTGKGVLTEVYLNQTNKQVTIVEIYTYIARVISDYDANRDVVNIEILDTEGDVNYSKDYRTQPTAMIPKVNGVLYGEDFPEISGLKEDDYIIFNYSNGQGANDVGSDSIECWAVADIVTGTVSSVTDADTTGNANTDLVKSVTLGGEPYSYNYTYTSRGTTNEQYELGTDAVVALDFYGNIIWDVDAIAAGNNFLYVDGIVRATGFSNRASANVYFADGTNDVITVTDITVRYDPGVGINSIAGTTSTTSQTVVVSGGESGVTVKTDSYGNKYAEINLEKLSGTTPTSSDYGKPNVAYDTIGSSVVPEDVQFDGWYSYTKNGNGTYKLTQLWRGDHFVDNKTPKTKNESQVAYYEVADGSTEKVSGNVIKYFAVGTEFGSTTNSFVGNDSTVFIVINDGKMSTYTGIKNLPDIELNGKGTGSEDAIITAAKKDGSGRASVVLIIDDDAKISGKKTEDMMFIINLAGMTKTSNTADGENVYTYNVILNGVKTTIQTKERITPSSVGTGDGKVWKAYAAWTISGGYYEFDSADELDLAYATTPGNEMYIADTSKNDNIEYDKSGDLTIGGKLYHFDKDTKIYVLLTNGSSNNKLLGGGDNNNMLEAYSAASLAGLDGTVSNPAFATFTYDYYGILKDDVNKDDTIKILYVIIREAK